MHINLRRCVVAKKKPRFPLKHQCSQTVPKSPLIPVPVAAIKSAREAPGIAALTATQSMLTSEKVINILLEVHKIVTRPSKGKLKKKMCQ